MAVAPGIPGLDEQEKRDTVPRGTYAMLARTGTLRIAKGLRVQPPSQLMAAIRETWGVPDVVICDRFRINELKDCAKGVPVLPRVARWSEAGEDIRAVRKGAADGPLACAEGSRSLLAASLAAATVKSDDQGNTRLVKRGTNNTARDDVAAALVLACGEFTRRRGRPPRRLRWAA